MDLPGRLPAHLVLVLLLAGCGGEGPLAPPVEEAGPCASHAECVARSAKRPICVAGACQPCTRNYQCPGSACDDDGACHDPRRVLLVDDDPATCRGAGAGAGERPYCHVRDALRDPGIGGAKDVILIRPSRRGGYFLDGDYITISESVRLVGARADRGAPPVLLREPILVKTNLKRPIAVGLDDLRISAQMSGAVSGILCLRDGEAGDPGVAFDVRWCQVDHTPFTAVATEWCGPMRFISNVITDNGFAGGGGVSIADPGQLTMVNNIVARNGSATSLKGGVALSHQVLGSLIAFNTMVDNHCAGIDEYYGCNIHCHHHDRSDIQPMYLNIATGTDPGRESVTGGCEMMNSVLPASYQGFGRDNLMGVQPQFVDPAQGDYHLLDTAANRRLRVAISPSPAAFDVDDDPRPGAGGVDIGADQLSP